jgi:acetoin utilization deacetylase AcuC-like enzyme
MKAIKVFYRDEQTVTDNTSFSPSAGKPAKVLASWQNLNVPIEQKSFKPITRAHIALAHEIDHVEAILACRRSNGFGNTLPSVAKSLRYTTGSLAAAAIHAFKTKEICASLTSGFHHAGYSSASGFCTFNGLVIAAQMIRLYSPMHFGAVGILDMDQHYGNGTDNIIQKLDLKYIKHWTLGSSNVNRSNAKKFFKKQFRKILEENFSRVDVLIYQAGADPWINDPLGGRLTKKQLRLRDRMVFEFCRENKIGCAFNLAGGYAPEFQNVLDIHNNTLIEAGIACGLIPESRRADCNIDDGVARTHYEIEDDHDHEVQDSDEFHGISEQEVHADEFGSIWDDMDSFNASYRK